MHQINFVDCFYEWRSISISTMTAAREIYFLFSFLFVAKSQDIWIVAKTISLEMLSNVCSER